MRRMGWQLTTYEMPRWHQVINLGHLPDTSQEGSWENRMGGAAASYAAAFLFIASLKKLFYNQISKQGIYQ